MLAGHPELSDAEILALEAMNAVDASSAESVPYKTVRLIPGERVQHLVAPALQAVSECLESEAHVLRGAVGSMSRVRQGLRRLAVAQVGSRNHIDEEAFADALARQAIAMAVPVALRAAAATQEVAERRERLEEAALLCERDPSAQNARAASDEADAAWKAGIGREQLASALAAGIAGFRAASAAGLTRVAFPAGWRAAKATSVLTEALRAVKAADHAEAGNAHDEPGRERMICEFLDGAVAILADLGAPGVELLWLADERVAHEKSTASPSPGEDHEAEPADEQGHESGISR